MILEDFHVHTPWCDGKDTAETIVRRALELGMTRLGFSGHAHTPCDESYCMSAEKTAGYQREIESLRAGYADRITILCGIEQDLFSDLPADSFDYAIGSTHYLKFGDEYIPVDEKPQLLLDAAQKHCRGDFYALIERYYEEEAAVIEHTHADLIGHFDLITKFNEGNKLFDEECPRYLDAAFAALDELLKTGRPFEINTGAISRGWRSRPYPALPILRRIAEKGGHVVLSSDSHRADTLCARFAEAETLCESVGLRPEPFRVWG
ncbi:MAG: histidinol-phosphatase [Pyramidobacter sp.]|nr:histidinol-phosphatase [Pyramidobacter sp.]